MLIILLIILGHSPCQAKVVDFISLFIFDRIGCRFYCGKHESSTFQLCSERYYTARCCEDTNCLFRSDMQVTDTEVTEVTDTEVIVLLLNLSN